MTLIAEFDLPGLPKMTNAIGRAHWTAKHREAKKWKGLVFEQCVLLKICGLHMEKAHITLTRHSKREPDCDGLTSGFKHVLDGLVVAGVIEDDKPSVIGSPIYRWAPAKQHEGKITIRIEDPLDLDFRAVSQNQSRHGKVI